LQVLRNPAEFSTVLQARKRINLPGSERKNAAMAPILEAYVHQPESDPLQGWRLGIVVSRKAAPLAVQRNWLKRHIRCICRENETAQGLDLVFRARLELKQHYLEAKQKRQLRQLRDRLRAEISAYLALVKK
jgi:ribonuclease P protein component